MTPGFISNSRSLLTPNNNVFWNAFWRIVSSSHLAKSGTKMTGLSSYWSGVSRTFLRTGNIAVNTKLLEETVPSEQTIVKSSRHPVSDRARWNIDHSLQRFNVYHDFKKQKIRTMFVKMWKNATFKAGNCSNLKSALKSAIQLLTFVLELIWACNL